jgi:hypothetical protein
MISVRDQICEIGQTTIESLNVERRRLATPAAVLGKVLAQVLEVQAR